MPQDAGSARATVYLPQQHRAQGRPLPAAGQCRGSVRSRRATR